MRAAVLHNYGQPMKVEEVEIDDPKPTEVKVKIAASGVCHSDYAFILGEQYWAVSYTHLTLPTNREV